MEKYPKREYAINPQPMTINMQYKKVGMNIYFGNQYSYFQEEIDDRFPEPLFDELDLNVFVDADHRHDKVMRSPNTGIISVVGSTPTTWS